MAKLDLSNLIGGEIEYLSLLLNSIIQLHIDHFQTRSFSRHKALEEGYEGLTDLMDTLIETRQGESLIIFKGYKSYPLNDYQDSIQYLTKIVVESKKYREGKSTNIQNIVDEILSLCEKTIYKLEFLQ